MKHISEVIVVEGKTDVAFLSTFIDGIFLMTGGTSLSPQFYTDLEQVSHHRGIIILTDPDGPGEQIRKAIEQKYPQAKHVFLTPLKAKKGSKVGVAESTKEYVLSQLDKAVTFTPNLSSYTMDDLMTWGWVGSVQAQERRNQASEQLQLGQCNAKTFLKRLNARGLTRDDIETMVGEQK